MRLSNSIPTVALLVMAAVLLPGGAAFAQRPSADQQILRMEQRVRDLNGKIDRSLQQLFRDQVKAAVYRRRLADLQHKWSELFAQVGLKRKKAALPPLEPTEFRIEEAAGSDASTLARALVASSCKRRKGCRIWARIAFGTKLVKKGKKARVWAEVKNKKGTTSVAVPASEVTVDKGQVEVSLSIGRLSIYKDHYLGTLQVVFDGRYKAKAFEFDLLNTY